MKMLPKQLLIILISSVSLIACKKDDEKPSVDTLKKSVVSNYSNLVYTNYLDAYNEAKKMQIAINEFVASPSENSLAAAKQAWLDARIPYLQTEAFRFYNGPIDDEDGPEGLLNAWPMDEKYIDYVSTDANSGIIYDTATYKTINTDLIESLNEAGGETNISTGYHAIEFLLWGQDLSTTSAGNRPHTDYLTTGGTANFQARRAQYLIACADLLVQNLDDLVNEWKPNASNYRATFEAAPVDESIKNILLGIGSLCGGELSGERMTVAFQTQLQEDEHSCFSDNTHNDIVYDVQGIENVYHGKYTKVDGTVIDGVGFDDLLAQTNTTLKTAFENNLTTSKNTSKAIVAPFDQEILNEIGRARISATIDSLKSEADKIVEIAKSLGISLIL